MKCLKKLNKLKLAFITGASKGIGRSTAITFANAGWDLILLSRNIDLMEKLKNELLTTKSKISLVKCDLSNPQEIEHCAKDAIKKYGCPSVLINNAGCAFNGPLVEMDFVQWEQTIQINLTSVFQICRSIVPQMRKDGGLVINVSSHASYNAFPNWGAYCISKSALTMFTKCLREEERSNSIKACTITLGSVNTPLWDSESINSDFDRASMLSSSEVADTILYMAKQPESQLIEDLTLMPAGGVF
ncbi:SDR family oxidoreductase [uncultured Prochlorococcus sp.]|uniref:SDR family oxidoreductase n=1 Tax=uncultured Prochlorococcus sp. TaxID=159733 RepID=UPI002587B1A1|nr:SDR family oxidoreductase [uncultured Prochlorococcus sp.]